MENFLESRPISQNNYKFWLERNVSQTRDSKWENSKFSQYFSFYVGIE